MDLEYLLLRLNRVAWVSFLEQEKIEEAIRYFEMYIVNFDSLKNHPTLGKYALDEIAYSRSIFLDKMTLLGRKYYELKDWSNAAICYAAYFKHNQENVEVIKNFLECLSNINMYDIEVDLLLYLEQTKLKDPTLYRTIAEVYANKKNYVKAVEFMEKYVDINMGNIPAQDYNLYGCYVHLLFTEVTQNVADAKKAVKAFVTASDMSPGTRLYAKNATIVAAKINDVKTGRKCWDRVLATNAMNNDDKYDYAAYCLKNSDFDGWHKYFGFRFQKENNATVFPKIPKALWDGTQDLSNSTLLVRYEQGFGDTFLMYGYLPRLTKIAKHVIFIVQDAVYDLLKDNKFGIEIIPASQEGDFRKFKYNYYIPSMSVPIALKMKGNELSVGEGYIKADKALIKAYKKNYFNNDKFKIGLSLSGSVTGDRTRDIDINQLLPLDNLENVALYCITKGIPDDKFNNFKHNKIINLGNKFANFSETAAAIENCDLILTTDNVILNLAGGLGKKTFALFNWSNQFRWFDLTGDNIIWLTSVKPFVNDAHNAWDTSVKKAVKEIKKLIK